MLALDEDAIICDFAQYYHIYDLWQMPIETIATLAAGLDNDSRIKRKLSGMNAPINTMLLAVIADGINFVCWSKSEDAKHKRNRPKSILKLVLGKDKKKKDENIEAFDSAEEFEEWRKKKIGG